DSKKIPKSPLVNFIELKNSMLTIKILEKERDYKEILTHSECLFDQNKKKNQELSIKLGFKMCDIHLSFYEFDKTLTILNEMHKIIKRQLYFSPYTNRFPEFIEHSLTISSRAAYCCIIIG